MYTKYFDSFKKKLLKTFITKVISSRFRYLVAKAVQSFNRR